MKDLAEIFDEYNVPPENRMAIPAGSFRNVYLHMKDVSRVEPFRYMAAAELAEAFTLPEIEVEEYLLQGVGGSVFVSRDYEDGRPDGYRIKICKFDD